jgi:dTDP-4-amino-4,6-dideoxygalactose transaminase
MTNEEFYKEYMLYSLHGQSKDAFSKMQKGAWEYDIVYPAFKNNMTDVLAAVGLVQLKRYDGLLERRFELIKLYEKILDSNKIQVIKHYDSNFRSSGHLLLCNLIGLSVEQRNKVILELADKGISTNVHYKPLPMFTAYKNLGFHIEDYPNAYNKYSNEVTLPLHTLLSNEDVVYVSQCVNHTLIRKAE